MFEEVKPYVVRTYKELELFFRAFNEKRFNFLIIKSRGGLGKTFSAKRYINNRNTLWINGHATPLKTYIMLMNKPSLIVIDDVDSLLQNKIMSALLKQICDTSKEKTIRYITTAKYDSKKIPEKITIKSKVLMLCNKLNDWDENIQALLTRALFIEFQPSNQEILKVLKTFAKNKKILSFLEKFYEFSLNLNFRAYKIAEEMYKAKLDWEDYLINILDIDKKIIDFVKLSKEEFIKKYNKSEYYRKKTIYENLIGNTR